MIGGGRETPRSPGIRWLIDAIYGSPRPWGFGGFALVVGVIVLMIAAALLTPQQAGLNDPTSPTTSPAVICLVILLAVAAVVLIGSQWLIRRSYRMMYGSAYDRS